MARAAALRTSILLAMGIVPLACGGTTLSRGERGDGGGGGGSGGSGGPGKPVGTGGGVISGIPPIATGGTGFVPPPDMMVAGAGGAFGVRSCTPSSYDPATGLVQCLEGYQHRVGAVACEGAFGGAPSFGGESAEGGDGPTLACGTGDFRSVCTGVRFPYCDVSQPGPTCAAGCQTDQDCGLGSICLCGHPESPTGGVCRHGNCRTDSDCGMGLLCASYDAVCGDGGFACQAPSDECQTNRDCGNGTCTAADRYPIVTPTSHRVCEYAVCGRPFLVDAQPRLATVVTTSAWGSAQAAAPRVEHLSLGERAALAAHWTRMGQMEHASIAAFARFSLQLLSLGAPPELVSACTRALSDETAHTQLCFQLASAYAGCDLGPGPLDVSGSLELTSLGEIVDLVIAEGCFGETVAALEAMDAADSASDPVIAAAYAQIGRDEQRHAELAFQFLRWAMERDPHVVRQRVSSALDACFDGASAAGDVVVPCLLALLRAPEQSLEAAS